MRNDSVTLGLIVGNRGFFPDHLARSGRQEMIAVLEKAGVKVVALTPADSKHGAVETREESHKCADLFKRHRDEIDGVIVTLPNFGEERASPTRCGSPGWTCPCSSRRRRTRPGACPSATGATASAGRCRPATTSSSTGSGTR